MSVYISRRHSFYYVKRSVPAKFLPILGKTVW